MIDGNLAMNSHFENMSEKDMQDMEAAHNTQAQLDAGEGRGKVLRWVKASERKPTKDGLYHCDVEIEHFGEWVQGKSSERFFNGYWLNREGYRVVWWLEEKDAFASTEDPLQEAREMASEAGEKPFRLSEIDIKQLLDRALKPEEIAGEASLQHARIDELIHWFVRFSQGNANGKWFQAHAFELAYYVATNAGNRFIDLQNVKQKAFLEGIQTPPDVRALLDKMGQIPKQEPVPVQQGTEPKMDAELSAQSDIAAIEYGKLCEHFIGTFQYDNTHIVEAHENGQIWMYRKLQGKISDLTADRERQKSLKEHALLTIEDLQKDRDQYKQWMDKYHKALSEIVKASQPIKDNPNCAYILKIAEEALK